MIFQSILFEKPEDFLDKGILEAPDFFVDLNLDQIVDTIIVGREEYNLKPFFYSPLPTIEAIKYRQEVMHELEENKILFESIKSFTEKMHTMREHLARADKLRNKYQKERWFLDAVEIYCDAVNSIVADLDLTDLRSCGLLRLREYMKNYAQSTTFTMLLAETKKLQTDLSTIEYSLMIKNNTVEVRHYASEADYSAIIEDIFAKFKQDAVKDYKVKFYDQIEMNNVEENILNLVAQLYPDIFLNLDNYYSKNGTYADQTIMTFSREIQFYIAYLEYIEIFKQAGLPFCYPEIGQDKNIYDYEGFDLALAYKVIDKNGSIVCNDFYLKAPERIIVVSGPNQGGKTTFARMFGQLHYLASLGCPIPGREAKLFLFDRLFTHFEREETIQNISGKLEDDLIRIYNILNQATTNSIIIMNEIFASTTLQDALFLSKKIMEKISQMDLVCVWVTFLVELASFNNKTVSMVAETAPENPTRRTFKIIKKNADGLSYAISIAQKYRLTYDHLIKRIRS